MVATKSNFNNFSGVYSPGLSYSQGTIVADVPIQSSNTITAPNFISGFIALATGTDTRLTTNSSETQYYTGAGKTYFLPTSTSASIGTKFDFINDGTGPMTIKNSSGTTVDVIPAGATGKIMLAGTGESSWYSFPQSGAGSSATLVFNSEFTPRIHTTGPSTYTFQMGSWSAFYLVPEAISVTVNFQMVVASYASDANVCTFDLPLQASGARQQFITLMNLQGSNGVVPGSEYSSMTSFGKIEPEANEVTVYTNYSLMPGDLWVGNFTYNVSLTPP